MKYWKTGITIMLASCGLFFLPVKAGNTYVIDESNTLSAEKLNALNDAAEAVTEEYQCGVYVVFTDDLNGYSESEYAQGVYMNHALGYGNDHSGVLLAIAVEDRYFNSVSYGSAGNVFTQAEQERMQEDILDDLSNDDWYGAAERWISDSEEVLSEGGYQYQEHVYTDPEIDSHIAATTPEERRTAWASKLPFAAIAAFGLSLLINFIRKSRLKTTGIQHEASEYIKPGAVNLNIAQDYYAGTTRSVQRIPRNNNTSGGSGSSGYHSSGFTSGGSGHHF